MKHILLQDSALAAFRTRFCEKHRHGACQNADRCEHSHCQTWQRRNPAEYFYSAKLCPDIEFIKRGPKMCLVRRCHRGRACRFAHSKEEELYHPDMYKTRTCNSYPNCARYFCPFAHVLDELRPQSKIAPSPPQQCPSSPMSTVASTTAASSLSPALSAFSLSPEESSFEVAGAAWSLSAMNSAAAGWDDAVDLMESLAGLAITDDQHVGPASSERAPLTPDEARLYSELLIDVLQREGLTAAEREALERYKLEGGSFGSLASTIAPSSTASRASFGSFERLLTDQKAEFSAATTLFEEEVRPDSPSGGMQGPWLGRDDTGSTLQESLYSLLALL